jgi:hypothetical protein
MKRSFLKLGRIDLPECDRCYGGKRAQYEVSSDIIHIRVCFECAEEAQRIGLTVKPPIHRFASPGNPNLR